MNRTEHISEWLNEIVKAIELTLHDYPASRWFDEAPDDPSNLHRPFGYLAPTTLDLHASSELILTQVADAGLDDDDFVHYLDAVEIHMYGHITHMGDENIEALLDKALWTLGPGSVELMNHVQMTALDKRCAL